MSAKGFSHDSSMVTEGIAVSVRTVYLPQESDPSREIYVFAYLIRIENRTSETVQLLSRHWDICDANGVKRVVDGEGVVGVKPVLKPGETHEYASGCDFTTPVGKMEGHYTFVRTDSGTRFTAGIPPFIMITPATSN